MSILTARSQHDAFAQGRFLRLVNWHNTPASTRDTLRAELHWYRERYTPVLPEDLDRLFETGRWHLEGPGFIPTFYDSYLNNVTVAAPILEELGITAWFFPTTAILDVAPADQHEYAEANHFTVLEEERAQPRFAMTWDDLAGIAARHVVAAHTANHAAAKHIVTAEDAEREIHTPIRQITELTGRTPPSFAFLYGTPPEAGTTAGDAVLASGIRYATTNTALVRIVT